MNSALFDNNYYRQLKTKFKSMPASQSEREASLLIYASKLPKCTCKMFQNDNSETLNRWQSQNHDQQKARKAVLNERRHKNSAQPGSFNSFITQLIY